MLRRIVRGPGVSLALLFGALALIPSAVLAQQPVGPECGTCPPTGGPRMLGNFIPQPYMSVGGTSRYSQSYAPLGMFGNVTLAEYGPQSANRQVAAPVVTYSRGYDGVVRQSEGIGFTFPYRPSIAPLTYPTRANFSRGFGVNGGTPPAWDSPLNWIDQN